MASQEPFQCSICLDVFTEPVSTPCGHNYCKACITGYWAINDISQCPLCNETFFRTPELRVNVEFRDMLEIFKRARAGDDAFCAHPWEVPCDLCQGMKCKATKSCLVCLASYCNAHLEPHHTTQALKWHKLIDPAFSLEERMCKKHNKLKELFCKQDQSCICAACMRDDHMMHEAISFEEEAKERKTQLKLFQRDVDHNLREKSAVAERIQNSMKQGRLKVEKTKVEIEKAFADLVALIETRKMKLIDLLEEKQKAAEQKAQIFIRRLQQEIDENQEMTAKLEELLKTDDDFRLLQGLPSIPTPSNSEDFPARAPVFLDVKTVKAAVAQTTETLTEHMDNIMINVAEEAMDSQTVFDDDLGKIQQYFAEKVTLDPSTAHPCLIVSVDRTQVRDGGSKRSVPDSSSRFDCLHYVLANEGFSSGKFYYEVALKGLTTWEIGVTRETISKKGLNLSLSPENGCWMLGLYWKRCQANASPPVVLSLSKELQKVGVFVDYEGRLVSFYDVDTRALIYSFTNCDFTPAENTRGSVRSGLFGHRVYTGTQSKTRIYPIFRPSSAPLQITPIRQMKGKKRSGLSKETSS